MTPRFSRKEHGYDMRQVDEYVDQLLAENHELSRVNHQFLLLYLTGEIPVQAGDEPSLDKATVDRLLAQMVDQQSYDPYADLGYPIEELVGLTQKPKRRKVPILSIFLCLVVAAFLVASYWFGGEITSGPPQSVGGFSAMVMLSTSMQHDIPQDSLIVIRQVDPATIRTGEDITFLSADNRPVTRRVAEIQQNYGGTGMRGFVTVGTANAQRDTDVVLAEDLVGRVIFSNLLIGRAVVFVRANILLVSIFFVATVAIIAVLRTLLFGGEKKDDRDIPHFRI